MLKKKLLIAKTSAFGDIVQTFYVIEDIARGRPDLEIYWCVDERFVTLAQLQPSVKAVIPFPAREWAKTIKRWSTWRAIRTWIRTLRSYEFDIALDLQGMYKSAFICWASGATHLIGRTRNSSVEGISNVIFNSRLDLLRTPGLAGRLRNFSSRALHYDLHGGRLSSGLLAEPCRTRRLALIVGASSPGKTWPRDNWFFLLDAIDTDRSFDGYSVDLVWGSDSEKKLGMLISEKKPRVLPLERLLPPPRLATFLKSCAVVVGVDTGPTHFAVALHVPTVMIFGTTSQDHNSSAELGHLRTVGTGRAWPSPHEVLSAMRSICSRE